MINNTTKNESVKHDAAENSDASLLDLLRRSQTLSISQLATQMGVTATAVRQRLNRLMAGGLVERNAHRAGRGRPSHNYSLTAKGVRQAGTNYADLAIVLWEEIRQVKDPEVRRGLLKRVVDRMADGYRAEICGNTLNEKMESLQQLMSERHVPFEIQQSPTDELPVLTALACPYPDLAEQDHSVCAMERMMFAEILGEPLKLTQCRLDGATCCTFEAS